MRVFPVQNPDCWNKPLWVIYGYDCFPSILCCKINNGNIWGFSIYRRSPGFRTLGMNLETWYNEEGKAHTQMVPEFYDDHEEALEKLRKITSHPKLFTL